MILIKEHDVKVKCCDNCGQNKGVKSIVIKTGNYQHSITLCKKCRSNLRYLLNCTDFEVMRMIDKKPVLIKPDHILGYAFFCPHCKVFQCSGKGKCTKCGGEIDWKNTQEYKGRVRWK